MRPALFATAMVLAGCGVLDGNAREAVTATQKLVVNDCFGAVDILPAEVPLGTLSDQWSDVSREQYRDSFAGCLRTNRTSAKLGAEGLAVLTVQTVDCGKRGVCDSVYEAAVPFHELVTP